MGPWGLAAPWNALPPLSPHCWVPINVCDLVKMVPPQRGGWPPYRLLYPHTRSMPFLPSAEWSSGIY